MHRGLLAGLFGFATFFLSIALLIEHSGRGLAFAAAIASTLLVQGVALRWLQRQPAE